MEQQKVAAVFGAGSGLGQAVAERFEQEGWSVMRVTRAECDLADPTAVARWIERAGRDQPMPELCVYCAGTSEVGRLDDLPPDAFRHCFEVNFYAPLTILLHLSRRGPVPCKRFVFIHSGTGDFFLGNLSPYSLSKRALRDVLYFRRLEGALADVEILEVWPGPMATPFNDKTRKHGAVRLPAPLRARPPERVAEAIYRAVTRGKARLRISRLPALLGSLQSMCPSLFLLFVRCARWLGRGSKGT
jgi:NAD(P)-dependent dehydrogenase (short-subunit alcohol dehydrogenase family)